MSSGLYSCFRLPTALADRMRSTPSTLRPLILARKFSSDGRMRWPRPCRARNATRRPRSIPVTYGPDGSPNGVAMVFSSRSVSSAMSYKPLPPMMPISMLMPDPDVYSPQTFQSESRFDAALALFLADIAGGDARVVREEHQRAALHSLADQLFFRRQRVERIQIKAHDPRVRHMGRRRHQVGNVRRALAARFDRHDLVVHRVPAGAAHPHAR